MRRPHHLRSALPALLLAFICSALAFGVPRASATDPFPTGGVATLSNGLFEVHYNRDDVHFPDAYITQEKAGDVLGMAERAYRLYRSWGYATPVPDTIDGDSLLDISVDDFCSPVISYAWGTTLPDGGLVPPFNIDAAIPKDAEGKWCRWNGLINSSAPATAGEIHLDATTGLGYHMVAHEVFHLFQRAMDSTADQWLREGTAEWAAFRAETFLTPTLDDLGQNPDRTADCVGTECGDTELDRNGYPGWLLFEYLSERYGTDAVKAVWDEAAANPADPSVNDLSTVLAAKGSTLESFFNDYATARLTGNFSLAAIKNLLPTAQASVSVGDLSGTLPTTNVAVNHLAARFVTLHHGAPTDIRAPCYAATLTINVTIPAGVTSTPYYFANTFGAVAQAFSVSGSTATLTVPWNTCAGSPDAYISLPNDTWNPGLDGREFVIGGTVTVNLDAPASPSDPSGAKVTGLVVAAPTSDPAPTLTMYAPEVLRVNARDRALRFAVFSSSSGKLRATLRSITLGTMTLRAGNNDVRFTLPKSLVSGLRKTRSNNVLSVTSLSPQGTQGGTITRRVVIHAAPKKRRRH